MVSGSSQTYLPKTGETLKFTRVRKLRHLADVFVEISV